MDAASVIVGVGLAVALILAMPWIVTTRPVERVMEAYTRYCDRVLTRRRD